jgi:phospholipase/carboxylesterase
MIPEAALQNFAGWTFRLRKAPSQPSPLLVLLHGWRGDENSMWVFADRLPPGSSLLAVRAPHPDPGGGYTWRLIPPGDRELPSLQDLEPAADDLLAFLDSWSASAGLDATRLDLVGFSQGAALAHVLAVLHPQRIGRYAALSGFLPRGAEEHLAQHSLDGKLIFLAHGRQDERVPVGLARQAAARLEGSGGRVSYCESDTGHKVSLDCLKALESFFLRDELAE